MKKSNKIKSMSYRRFHKDSFFMKSFYFLPHVICEFGNVKWIIFLRYLIQVEYEKE